MPRDKPISTEIGFRGTNSKMIGLSDQFEKVKTHLLQRYTRVYGLYGTAGIGKTTLAMQIYQDEEIQSKFECRAWVTVGRVHQQISQMSRGIIAQLCGNIHGDEEIGDSPEEVGDYLKKQLYGKNSLIVLDDVWEVTNAWYFYHVPYIEMGCINVLFTGRHRKWIGDYLEGSSLYEVRYLNEEESMELLCEKVFGDEICPPQLHKLVTKIAKLCEGLPLLIVTVADILSKSEHNRDPVYWNEVAERRNSVFTDAYNQISKVLFPSYDYLPQSLKMSFLFMGVFPLHYDTPPFKIITMLTAKGLWCDWKCLTDLGFDYSLVLRNFRSVDKTSCESTYRKYKTCWLHCSWRHVCRGEASKHKFYRVLNKLIDAGEEVLNGQRGLCLENNILFGIKEFGNSVRLNCASFTRSILFYGPYHQYPIPIDVGFRLLREIDALTQRFYTFPVEILSLVQLKYLALTCNGELPATISKLFNLRTLIIHPHLNIRHCRAPSYVPIQIWDMQDLEHIEILGKSLVAPSHVASLKNLKTLVGVNASICTVLELSKRIPNIRKLGIQIELTPYDDHNNLLSCFDCISTLELDILKLSITNPVVKKDHAFPVTPGSLKLPHNLKKLHLSGMGFPWEYMDVVGSLPFLQALNLRSYAFQGSHWAAKRYSFRNLRFLLIEESDLVQWKPRYGSFPNLTYLSMKHCYKLKEIGKPASLTLWSSENPTRMIELEDCNPLALISAKQLIPDDGVMPHVIVSSSYYEKPTTIKLERQVKHMTNQERQVNRMKYYGRSKSDVEEEDDDGDVKKFPTKGRIMKARAKMRRMRKRMVTNIRMIMRKQRRAQTSSSM
ncbi:putative late blight resistance protein homolog R1A-10 [Salvia hispanica]|uniref:putative late blight resistance protein homolog R1A-10 n=1 Tax=Salvia hispanica TaxID=49212 RepID=UPI0020097B95|nr:putative late blight resistance protein homolog R1A-10 [Salvia hispanica]